MHPLSRTSSATSATSLSVADAASHASAIHTLSYAAAETEFRSEVAQSLERAFAEGHSVENAAVELKTLRMASNVPLRRVREAVVGAIIDRVALAPADPAQQRAEIARTVRRWGALIDKIGGVDPVETVEALQQHCAAAPPARQAIFGQTLAALYQLDLVDEEHIRAWHASPVARGEGVLGAKPGSAFLEGLMKCWAVGTKMIEQFDEASESEEESSEEDEEDEEDAPAPSRPAPTKPTATDDDEEESEESEDTEEESEDEDPAPAKPAVQPTPSPATAPAVATPSQPSKSAAQAHSESDSDEDDSEAYETGSDAASEPPAKDAGSRS